MTGVLAAPPLRGDALRRLARIAARRGGATASTATAAAAAAAGVSADLHHAQDFLHAGLAGLDHFQCLLLQILSPLLAEQRLELVRASAGLNDVSHFVVDLEYLVHAGPADESQVVTELARDRIAL